MPYTITGYVLAAVPETSELYVTLSMFDALYAARKARYERFADHIIDNNGALDDTVRAILEVLR